MREAGQQKCSLILYFDMLISKSEANTQVTYQTGNMMAYHLVFLFSIVLVGFYLPYDAVVKSTTMAGFILAYLLINSMLNWTNPRKIKLDRRLLTIYFGGLLTFRRRTVQIGKVTAVSFKDKYRKSNGIFISRFFMITTPPVSLSKTGRM